MNTKKEYYKNGVLKSETQVNENGDYHGVNKLFHPNGQLKVEVVFHNDEQSDGDVVSFDFNGVKTRSSCLKDSEFHGPIKEWWPNGQLKYRLDYINGEPSGKLKEWSYFGAQITSQEFADYVPFAIDVKNKINYKVLKEDFTVDLIFSEFLDDIKDQWVLHDLSSQYMVHVAFDSEINANKFLTSFGKKHSFEKKRDNLWSRDDFEAVQINHLVLIASLRYFSSNSVHWNINEYSKEDIKLDWIQGIGPIYHIDDLKKFSEETNEITLHIPYFDIAEDGDNRVNIFCQTKYIAEYFADQVILSNGGFESFRSLKYLDSWKDADYAYAGPLFYIFITGTNVMIVRLESKMIRVDGAENTKGISPYSNTINRDFKGLKRLIYAEGDGMVPDGRFWINEDASMISSWWDDDLKAAEKFKKIVREFDPEHPSLKLSNEQLVTQANSHDFVSELVSDLMSDITPKTWSTQASISDQYRIILSMGDNFMHLTIFIEKEL